MTNQEQRLIELKNISKKTAKEKAEIKVLEHAIKQQNKTNFKKNIFATQATTKINPLPIRFTKNDRTRLSNLANDLKNDNKELIIDELGDLREINDTKLLRAAVLLLVNTPHKEIIKAIKLVKKDMLR
jgi:hypothetical protein